MPVEEKKTVHTDHLGEYRGVSLSVRREDLLHPVISGNKWRKLKYFLHDAGKGAPLLSFGGAFSNHLLAMAAAGAEFGFETTGVVRGESHAIHNPTLRMAADYGMKFHFVSREDYRRKEQEEFIDDLHDRLGDFYLIPEGGYGAHGAMGCAEIWQEGDEEYDIVTVACGTGTTLAGLIAGAKKEGPGIWGFPALKGAGFLSGKVEQLLNNPLLKTFGRGRSTDTEWELILDYHFGGYAKVQKELIDHINRFRQNTGIPLDPVYTGKMVYGIYDLIRSDRINPGTRVLLIHTGGLQGIRGMNERIEKYGWNIETD